jgi:Ras-related protein Rab-5C
MSDSPAPNAPKPSSSVKLVLLGEAAVGKVIPTLRHPMRRPNRTN